MRGAPNVTVYKLLLQEITEDFASVKCFAYNSWVKQALLLSSYKGSTHHKKLSFIGHNTDSWMEQPFDPAEHFSPSLLWTVLGKVTSGSCICNVKSSASSLNMLPHQFCLQFPFSHTDTYSSLWLPRNSKEHSNKPSWQLQTDHNYQAGTRS